MTEPTGREPGLPSLYPKQETTGREPELSGLRKTIKLSQINIVHCTLQVDGTQEQILQFHEVIGAHQPVLFLKSWRDSEPDRAYLVTTDRILSASVFPLRTSRHGLRLALYARIEMLDPEGANRLIAGGIFNWQDSWRIDITYSPGDMAQDWATLRLYQAPET